MEYKQETAGSNSVFHMNGRLTYADHAAFRDLIGRISSRQAGKEVVFELSRLDFIDSAGLGMLLMAKDAADKADVSLALRSPQGQVRRLFSGQKFDGLFRIED